MCDPRLITQSLVESVLLNEVDKAAMAGAVWEAVS